MLLYYSWAPHSIGLYHTQLFHFFLWWRGLRFVSILEREATTVRDTYHDQHDA